MPGRGQLYIDEKLVAQIDVPVTTPLALGLTSGVTCGIAPGAPSNLECFAHHRIN
jgi:arylsulfatase